MRQRSVPADQNQKKPSPALDASGSLPLGDHDTDWLHGADYDGQLAVDVYQTPNAIIIKSPIAGVAPEDLDIAVNGDVITIRGRRHQIETIEDPDYLFQECYWGGFSRSIILPTEIHADKVSAQLKNGILTVTLPKAKNNPVRVIPVEVEGE